MTTPADYRQYAKECLVAMRVATMTDVKASLLMMAQRWAELADRMDGGGLAVPEQRVRGVDDERPRG